METILNNVGRVGNFTSSEISCLTAEGKTKGTLGKPALTYIDECNMERKLGRSLTDESNARPLTWGKLLEKRVFELLPIGYTLMGDQTIKHSSIECWSGSPDVTSKDCVGDIKCPITLKSFCQLVDPIYKGLTGMDAINAIRDNHKDGEKYYWQLVSNSIITDSKYAELIVYVPYQSELIEVKGLAVNSDETQRFYWIINAEQEELPFLVDGGYYNNLNIIRFEVPQADKDLLTSKVIEAKKQLIDFK